MREYPRCVAGKAVHQVHCSDCTLNPICLPLVLGDGEIEQLDGIVERDRPLPRGGVLFRAGEPFSIVYVVRAGSVKTSTVAADGDYHVTGFYLPGEIVGLDSIGYARDVYGSTATALETTAVCAIPFAELEGLASRMPALQHHLFALMSAGIRTEQQVMQMVGRTSAEARVASLLLSLSARYKRRRLAENKFRLPMSRADIGAHLGMALETVSRTLTRLQEAGILSVDGRDIVVLNRVKLCGLLEKKAG